MLKLLRVLMLASSSWYTVQGWDCFKGINFLLASTTRNRRLSTPGLQQHKDHLTQKLSPAEPYMLLQIILEPSLRFCS